MVLLLSQLATFHVKRQGDANNSLHWKKVEALCSDKTDFTLILLTV